MSKKKTPNQFRREVCRLVGGEYVILSAYDGAAREVRFLHSSCGYEFTMRPTNFLTGQRCPNCFGNAKKTTVKFKEEVAELVGTEYDVVGEYLGAQAKLLITHRRCGKSFMMSPTNFLGGQRCPRCKNSRGELKAVRALTESGLICCREHAFDDLRGEGGRPLRFDIACFNPSNLSLSLLVEYDGEFHYHRYYKNQAFAKTRKHDKLKNAYCKAKNIPLLRIPYWEFNNIGELVKQFVLKVK